MMTCRPHPSPPVTHLRFRITGTVTLSLSQLEASGLCHSVNVCGMIGVELKEKRAEMPI